MPLNRYLSRNIGSGRAARTSSLAVVRELDRSNLHPRRATADWATSSRPLTANPSRRDQTIA
jgi:hypothetical protein